MSRRRRPIRNMIFLFVVGMTMIMTALIFEAKKDSTKQMRSNYAESSESTRVRS